MIETRIPDLIARFRVLTERAAEACDRGDIDALLAALHAREVTLQRIQALVPGRQGPAPRRGAGDPPPASSPAVQRAVGEALELNVDLLRRVAVMRDSTRQELQRLEQDQAAVDGYASAMPRRRRLDLRR